MDYAPNVRFCELVLNGEYQGVYLIIETIDSGKNGARLNLSVRKKKNTFAGYILRLDRGATDESKNIETFSSYTYRRTDNIINIVYPGKTKMTDEVREEIRQDYSQFEKVLYSYDFNNVDYGYQNYIDTMSFADYFLINELTCNTDAGRYSTYIYKALDGRYRLCVWDFNSGMDGYDESQTEHMIFWMQDCLWFDQLFRDEDFTETLIKRYRSLRKYQWSDENLERYIDETVAYLGNAVNRNFEVWGYTFEEFRQLKPDKRNPDNYEEAVQQLKDFFPLRAQWMDENIETLRQYSAPSRNKSYNEVSE